MPYAPELAEGLVWPESVSDPALCLAATDVIQSDAPMLVARAHAVISGLDEPYEQARALYDYVRDEIAYDFTPQLTSRADWQATATLNRGRGFCQQKAVLLTTLLRAARIPAAIGFQHIKDHTLVGTRFEAVLPGGVIVCHGLSWVYLNGAWWAADATQDRRLCRAQGFRLGELRRGQHVRLPATTLSGAPHFTILEELGRFRDMPGIVSDLASSLTETWPALRALAQGQG